VAVIGFSTNMAFFAAIAIYIKAAQRIFLAIKTSPPPFTKDKDEGISPLRTFVLISLRSIVAKQGTGQYSKGVIAG